MPQQSLSHRRPARHMQLPPHSPPSSRSPGSAATAPATTDSPPASHSHPQPPTPPARPRTAGRRHSAHPGDEKAAVRRTGSTRHSHGDGRLASQVFQRQSAGRRESAAGGSSFVLIPSSRDSFDPHGGDAADQDRVRPAAPRLFCAGLDGRCQLAPLPYFRGRALCYVLVSGLSRPDLTACRRPSVPPGPGRSCTR